MMIPEKRSPGGIRSTTRRGVLIAAAFTAAVTSFLGACSSGPPPAKSMPTPPIVFVHGNGDSAGLWMTTEWRFESNGWPRDRLYAVDMPYPLARDDDAKPQEGRSSTTESMQYLSAEVDKVLKATGASQVVLMGNSRGGNEIRNYIANGGGAAKVSYAILGGTPNHGVWIDPTARTGNEFNGAGPFLTALNAPKGPDRSEVTPGVKWLTIRSDHNDKFAQPDGVWIGAKGTPTHVTDEGPALRGAENVVIPGIDHRETAYGAKAFEQAYRFVTGNYPAGNTILREPKVILDGKVSGYGVDNVRGSGPTNLPLVGATVEVYATNPSTGDRLGPAVHRKTIGADGAWGPFAADSLATYEFVLAAPGYATNHIYRSPFPRSSSIVDIRVERLADADKSAASVVTLSRPAGYLGVPRDRISLDGQSPPAGVPPGVPGVSTVKLKLTEGAGRSVAGSFNDERLVGKAWPAGNNELVTLELTY